MALAVLGQRHAGARDIDQIPISGRSCQAERACPVRGVPSGGGHVSGLEVAGGEQHADRGAGQLGSGAVDQECAITLAFSRTIIGRLRPGDTAARSAAHAFLERPTTSPFMCHAGIGAEERRRWIHVSSATLS
jgi:hypothetical protein